MNKGVKQSVFGNELMMLYGRVHLSQGEFASLVGISSVALRRWESGASCPKAESLKRVLAILTSKGAFSVGEEQTEAMHLWELAMERGLKVPFDEVWFRRVIRGRAEAGPVGVVPSADPMPCPNPVSGPNPNLPTDQGKEENLAWPPTREAVGVVPSANPAPCTHPPGKAKKRRKALLWLLMALAILTIIGSLGTLFFLTTQANEATREQASKTVIAQYPKYLPGSGTLAFFDPLSQQNGSKWGTFRGACQFTGGTYHIRKLEPAGVNRWCAPQGVFSNFTFEVELTIVQGDCGGLTFRDDWKGGDFYFFPVCQDGTYNVCKYTSYIGCTVMDRHSSTIKTGLGQQNKIAVVANGTTMKFYVNERQIDQLQDSSYTSGHIELNAALFYPVGHTTDVAYSNARLWTL